ncbi:DUF6882 domain-containing protein [Chryseobacterium turcicum]|uniref:Uncharacterized protein n=1 Tax=Chryseobacterium turcicum TaxID=2898076 RepID=A0A9Q3V455_9FLAO|nr:DUF6882 domain-containing protein [Chryseobacterium turcicum]MCD1116960.1 hypothetical protein [Chryseobacterium turcicum]
MGFFNKIFGQNDKTEQTNETRPQQNLTPCKTEQELIERYGGIAMDKQLSFGDFIGNNNWNINIANGEISFGDDIVLPMQVLGTISHSSQTWLWAWANTKSGLSENVIKQALELKKYGEENGIDLLRNDTFDFTKEDLHLIGIIASGINNFSGYYICDYGQGAMVVTIKSEKVDRIHKEDNHHRILTVFPQLISQFEMNHNFALTNYLIAKGYTISENGTKLIMTKNGQTITAEFDELSRLTKLNG